MKCAACLYEYDFDYTVKDGFKILIGDEEFIHISGNFYKHEDFEDKRIRLIACPKCKTIRINE